MCRTKKNIISKDDNVSIYLDLCSNILKVIKMKFTFLNTRMTPYRKMYRIKCSYGQLNHAHRV